MSLPPSSLIQPRTWRCSQRQDIKNNDDDSKKGNGKEEEFIISTDPRLLSIQAINAAYAMDFLYWANPFPEDELRQILNGSLCFGVYRYNRSNNNKTSASHGHADNSVAPNEVEQIGMARLITDTVTFAYLTDVYVLPAYQSRGLGSWLLDCVAETLSVAKMPHLRRVMLLTSSRESDGGKAERFYESKLGAEVKGWEVREDLGGKVLAIMVRKGAVQVPSGEGADDDIDAQRTV
ncbi:hypothetical protein VTN00DRAFT_8203 [Thermoascus crustaceus]|uniref:uncharacterized protein n=1 Tax=Thermoascus crustaceus TaxID=5088 RepID=UPI003743E52E